MKDAKKKKKKIKFYKFVSTLYSKEAPVSSNIVLVVICQNHFTIKYQTNILFVLNSSLKIFV